MSFLALVADRLVHLGIFSSKMTKKFVITAKMLEDLDYDVPKSDTKFEVAKKPSGGPKFTFKKYVIPSISSRDVLEVITNELDTLSEAESQENKIPVTIVKQHIELGLEYGKNGYEKPKLLDSIKSFAPVIDVRHHVSLVEVIHNILLLAESECEQVIFCTDWRRTAFLGTLCTALKFKETKLDDHIAVKDLEEFYGRIHFPYTSIFIFDSGDIESATYRLASSLYDSIAPWRVRSIYVQESCYENFCNRLENKLRSYPKDICADEDFKQSYKDGLEKIKQFHAKLLKDPSDDEYMPLICHDFNRDYFDTESYLSPVVTLKQFRTAKEALTLAKIETGGLASVWSEKLSTAYDFAEKIRANTVWINCLGELNRMIPFAIRRNSNCLGGQFAFLDFFAAYFQDFHDVSKMEIPPLVGCITNGWKVEASYQYQYSIKLNEIKFHPQFVKSLLVCGDKYINIDDLLDFNENQYWPTIYKIIRNFMLKTIVFPFGTTFAN